MYEGALEPVSNDEDWELPIEIVSDDDGEPFELTGSTASLRITDSKGCEVLIGSSTDGTISIDADDGIALILVRAARLKCLCSGVYRVAVRLTNGTDTTQILRADLPIVEGGF